MRYLTPKQREAQEWWSAVTNTLTLQYGPFEEPPRILSFDELLGLEPYKTYIWLEDLINGEIKGCEIVTGIDSRVVNIFAGGYYSLLRKNYGKKYQCWTAYPKEKFKGKKIALLKKEGE